MSSKIKLYYRNLLHYTLSSLEAHKPVKELFLGQIERFSSEDTKAKYFFIYKLCTAVSFIDKEIMVIIMGQSDGRCFDL